PATSHRMAVLPHPRPNPSTWRSRTVSASMPSWPRDAPTRPRPAPHRSFPEPAIPPPSVRGTSSRPQRRHVQESISMSLSTFRPLGGLGLVVSTALALPSAESNPSLTHDPVVRLVDLSLNVMTAAGASTASDGEIEELQAGHHDPKRRGFTFQNAELAIAGAVDPYFTAQAYIVAGEEGFELEEAFAETSSLPQGLQVRAGYFYTEIGRTNPSHPHSSPWLT